MPLDEGAVREAAKRLAGSKIEAVAVALIHAYANPAHEERVGAILGEVCPGISVTLSSQACPEVREYERTSTAIANAYVQPLMSGYLLRLRQALAELGYGAPIHLMTSGGSLASLETAARFPVRLVESGPAGGAILAGRIALERGERRILSFDMGGTTAKICLIDDGEPLKGRAFEVDRQSRFKKGSGLPVRIPVIEMVEIGAGGGSIARIDALQRIQVGPDSAGAEPGPACYGRGGTEPTVTDADLALGKIDPVRFAGGTIAVHSGPAEAALSAGIGARLSMSAEQAAVGVAEIVDENMANAARVHAVERGADIAERTLVAFGGAAPLHASRLAEKLGIARVVVPPDAGVGSAVGFLAAPAAYEVVRSRYMRLSTFDADAANALVGAMQQEAGSARPRRGRRTGGVGARLGVHALCRPGPRDHGGAARPQADRGRCGHIPRGLRARVHAPLRPPHPQRRDRDHELGGARHHGDRAAGKARCHRGEARAEARRRALRVRRRPRPPRHRADLRARKPGARRGAEGPSAHRRGRHLHLRLAALRCVRGCGRGADSDGKIVPSPRRASSARTGRGLG